MLRTTRPLLSSANRLGLASRAPQVRHAQLQLCTAPTLHLRLPRCKVEASRVTPLVFQTNFSSKPPLQPNTRDKEHEKYLAQQPLEPRPEEVSTQSSVRHVIEDSQAPAKSDEDFLKGLKGDVHTFQEALALDKVPREPYALGLAGTLPYMGTSVATLYLSWSLNTTWPTSSNFLNSILVSHETASQWLHLVEPVQVGYGAVIISFLGAIHWGLEFAEKHTARERTRFRYAMGVIAPAIAWPTVFMPVEWALTTQFLSFTFLYLADSRATTRGWTPHWYGTYRFVLTAVVGAAIFISLVGRAKASDNSARWRTSELEDLVMQGAPGTKAYHNWAKEEEEERTRLKKEQEEKEKKQKEEEEEKQKEEGKKKSEEGKNKGGKGGDKKNKQASEEATKGDGGANKEVGKDKETGEGKRETEKGKKE